jgi:hypothetical protein
VWKRESAMKNSGFGRDRLAGAETAPAVALIEREELLNGELRFVKEVSRRQEMEAELSEIRRGLHLLGFPTSTAGDRSS